MAPRRSNAVAEKKTKTVTTSKDIMKSPGSSGTSRLSLPPRGSEEALKQTAEHWAGKIMSSIYFDLNANCYFQCNATADDTSQQINGNLVAAAVEFMEQELANYMASAESFRSQHGEYQALEPDNRLFSFASQIGWKMFAICAHAEAFRRAFRQADPMTWTHLLEKIQENAVSIESYVHSRGLKWSSLIQNIQDPITSLPSVQEAIESRLDWKVDHPHHTVITLDGGLKEPMFKGKLQEHIDQNIYDPKNFDHTEHSRDPTKKRKAISNGCYLCGSMDPCGCTLQSRAGDLIELTEYPGKGTGIRSLVKFQRGDILDIFSGELTPGIPEYIYPLEQKQDTDSAQTLCYVSPHQYGNWTRFINHSCQPSTEFVVRTIGDRVVTTVEAIRIIFPFEEITLSYGKGYWSHRVCSCGHSNCVSHEKSKDAKNKRARKV